MATTEDVCVCVTCGGQGTIGDGGYIQCPACAHVWDQIIPLRPDPEARSMDADDYQREVLRTLPQGTSTDDTVAMAALGLAGEAGEVVEIVKKALYHETPFDPQTLKLELGDVLWYLAALCHVSDMTLGDVMAANVAKLRARYPHGFDPERSRNRGDTSSNGH